MEEPTLFDPTDPTFAESVESESDPPPPDPRGMPVQRPRVPVKVLPGESWVDTARRLADEAGDFHKREQAV